MNNRELGKIGEDMAAEILRRTGYEILKRNYRCRLGEVDIVAEKDDRICFIEVKTRRNRHYGRPCESVDRRKQEHIKRAAACYLKELEGYGYEPESVGFDIMEIMVEHIEDAF